MRLSHRFTTVAHNIDSLAVLAIVEQESCHNDWVSLTGGILNAATCLQATQDHYGSQSLAVTLQCFNVSEMRHPRQNHLPV